jgi:hypothetical protein
MPDYDKLAAQFGAADGDKYDQLAAQFAATPGPAKPANKDYQAGRAAPDWKRGLASGINGPLLGFGDEIAGAIGGAYDTMKQSGQSLAGLVAGTKPKSFSENYVANRDTVRGMQDANREVRPWSTGIANALGSLPLMLATGGGGAAGMLPQAMRAAGAAPAISGMGANAVRAAGTGIGFGAAIGAGDSTATTVSGLADDTVRAGAMSGALGGVLSPVAGALGAVARNGMQRVSKTSAAEYARQKVSEAFARDARGTLATGGYTDPLGRIKARFGKLGDEATLADAGGRNTFQLLDTLATLPGRTKEAADNMLRQRTAGVGARMRSAADDALGTNGERLPATLESLITRRQGDAAPLYARLRQIDIDPSEELAATIHAAEQLGMVKTGRDIATARMRPFTLDSQGSTRWNMGDLDHIKQGIDQALSTSKAMKPDGTLTPLGASYQELKTKLLAELDGATTNSHTGASLYADARAAYSNPTALIDAAKAGKMAINRDEAGIVSTMNGMSANELQAFRIGAFEGLRGKLGTQGGQTDIQNMWKNPATQEKLKAVFGDLRSYREFAASVAKEAQLKRLQGVGTGSQTAARQFGAGDLDLSAMTDAGAAFGAAKSGNVLAAIGSAKNAWNRVATPQAVRDQMGQMLLSQGSFGQQELNGMGGLIQSINNRNMLLSRGVGVMGADMSGGLLNPFPQMQQLPPR